MSLEWGTFLRLNSDETPFLHLIRILNFCLEIKRQTAYLEDLNNKGSRHFKSFRANIDMAIESIRRFEALGISGNDPKINKDEEWLEHKISKQDRHGKSVFLTYDNMIEWVKRKGYKVVPIEGDGQCYTASVAMYELYYKNRKKFNEFQGDKGKRDAYTHERGFEIRNVLVDNLEGFSEYAMKNIGENQFFGMVWLLRDDIEEQKKKKNIHWEDWMAPAVFSAKEPIKDKFKFVLKVWSILWVANTSGVYKMESLHEVVPYLLEYCAGFDSGLGWFDGEEPGKSIKNPVYIGTIDYKERSTSVNDIINRTSGSQKEPILIAYQTRHYEIVVQK